MSEVPSQESLSELNRALLERIQRIERRRTSQAMMKTVMGAFSAFNSRAIPEIMAGPTAQTRKSVLALEESLGDFDNKMKDIEDRYQSMLELVRRRTALLKAWNEAL